MSTVAERAERGAALLDERRPGWWQGIDLGRLDIGSTCNCVVGQVYAAGGFGAFTRALYALGVGGWDQDEEHGFDAECSEYAELTAAWRDLVLSRRAAAEMPA